MSEEKPLYAVLMLKGTVKVHRAVTDTLNNLRLSTANTCVIIPADDTRRGMLKKVAEYVTWGEINQDTLEKLLGKRGRVDGRKAKSLASKALKERKLDVSETVPVFRLSPPSGGLRALRLHYPKGDVGYRGEEINDLLLRMI